MKRQKTWGLLITIGLCLLIGLRPVQASPLLVANPVLTIAAAPWPLVINQGARLTVTASNPSPENADNVVVTAGVPNNMGLSNVTATQGEINVFNSAVTVHVGTLGAGQTMQVLLDVVVVAAYPTDAPFNLCAGLTFAGGTARLSCLPNQPAGSTPGRPPVTLSPNGSVRSTIPIARRSTCRCRALRLIFSARSHCSAARPRWLGPAAPQNSIEGTEGWSDREIPSSLVSHSPSSSR